MHPGHTGGGFMAQARPPPGSAGSECERPLKCRGAASEAGRGPVAMEAVGRAPSPPGLRVRRTPLAPTAPVHVRRVPHPLSPRQRGCVGWALPTPAPPSRGAHSPFPGVGVREVVGRRVVVSVCSRGTFFRRRERGIAIGALHAPPSRGAHSPYPGVRGDYVCGDTR